MSVYDCDFTAFLYPAFVVIVIYTRTLYGRCPPTSQIYVFLKEELCIQILFLCKKKSLVHPPYLMHFHNLTFYFLLIV